MGISSPSPPPCGMYVNFPLRKITFPPAIFPPPEKFDSHFFLLFRGWGREGERGLGGIELPGTIWHIKKCFISHIKKWFIISPKWPMFAWSRDYKNIISVAWEAHASRLLEDQSRALLKPLDTILSMMMEGFQMAFNREARISRETVVVFSVHGSRVHFRCILRARNSLADKNS